MAARWDTAPHGAATVAALPECDARHLAREIRWREILRWRDPAPPDLRRLRFPQTWHARVRRESCCPRRPRWSRWRCPESSRGLLRAAPASWRLWDLPSAHRWLP